MNDKVEEAYIIWHIKCHRCGNITNKLYRHFEGGIMGWKFASIFRGRAKEGERERGREGRKVKV